MDHLALWHTESNRVLSESGRRSSRRFSNTLDEEFSIVSEELLRSEETSEVGKLVKVVWVGAVLQRDMALWKSAAVNELVDAKLLDT